MSSDSRQPHDAASSYQNLILDLLKAAGIPEIEDWWPFIEEQKGQTDRGLAILGGTYLEWRIREAIKSRLPIWDDVAADDLFGTADKSSKLEFNEQCKLAYALGLVGKISLGDLKLIGEIRNRFAHRLHVRDFYNRAILERCNKLQLLTTYAKMMDEKDRKKYNIDNIEAMKGDTRDLYIGTVHMLGQMLVMASGLLRMPKEELKTFDEIPWRI